jgi:hypothetical protein
MHGRISPQMVSSAAVTAGARRQRSLRSVFPGICALVLAGACVACVIGGHLRPELTGGSLHVLPAVLRPARRTLTPANRLRWHILTLPSEPGWAPMQTTARPAVTVTPVAVTHVAGSATSHLASFTMNC